MTDNHSVECNDVEYGQARVLCVLWVVSIVFVSLGLYLSTLVFPEVDSHAAFRVIAMRFPATVLFSMLLMSIMVAWDFLTPGDTLAQISKDPLSASIFFSVFVWTIGYLVVAIV